MHTLWRRAKPFARSCRRHVSHFAAQSGHRLTRDTLTTIRLHSKRFTTLLYSTLIASAAVADVASKQRRNKHWDAVIGDAERSLGEQRSRNLPDPPAVKEADLSAGKIELRYNVGRGSEEDHSQSADQNSSRDSSFPSFVPGIGESNERRAHLFTQEGLRALDPNGHKFQFLEKSRTSPLSIYAPKASKRRETWTPKKLLTVELSFASLAMKFLVVATHHEGHDFKNKAYFEYVETLEKVTKSLRQIESQDAFNIDRTLRLDYPQYSPKPKAQGADTRALNSSIMRITSTLRSGQITIHSALKDIAHSLLVSPAPPDARTLAQLITHFSNMRCNDVVDMCIQCFFSSRRRPNEILVAAIAEHLSRIGDEERFHQFAMKIKGYHQGLLLAHPKVGTDGPGASRLRPGRNNTIIQVFQPDQVIFNILISSYLKFNRGAEAFSMYRWMRSQGMTADSFLFSAFMHYFSRTKDWASGIAMWKAFHARYLAKAIKLPESGPECSGYVFMLDLCKKCKKQHLYDSIRADAISKGLPPERLNIDPNYQVHRSQSDFDQRARERKLRILQHRVDAIIADLGRIALYVLVSQLIVSGKSTEEIKSMLECHANKTSYQTWAKRQEKLRDWASKLAPASRIVRIDRMEQSEDIAPRHPVLSPLPLDLDVSKSSNSAALSRSSPVPEESATNSTTDMPKIAVETDLQHNRGLQNQTLSSPNAQRFHVDSLWNAQGPSSLNSSTEHEHVHMVAAAA